MKKLTLKAHAKLNLGLNLLPEKGLHGYYRVHFINTQLKLADVVKIKIIPNKNEIKIISEEIEDKSNLAYEAARTFKERYSITDGVVIKIRKSIPIKAGLGGGSTDAASVINGLTRIFNIEIDEKGKLKLAKSLGMDVCYCVIGGPCEVMGVGDEIHPLKIKMPLLNILLVIPEQTKPGTGWVYGRVRKDDLGRNRSKIPRLIEALKIGSVYQIAKYIHNDFEDVITREFHFISEIKEKMLKYGALNATLAGSGLTVYGIFETRKLTKAAAILFRKMGYRAIHTETIVR